MDPLFRDLQDKQQQPSSATFTDCNTAKSISRLPYESIETYLERLTVTTLEALNTRAFESHPIIRHFRPDFRGALDRTDAVGSIDRMFPYFRALVACYPQTYVRAVDCKAYVYHNLGKADVYMNLEGTGNPPGLVRQGFCQLAWERAADGEWSCVRHSGMGGTVPAEDLTI